MNCPHCNVHVDDHNASRCFDTWVLCSIHGKKFEPMNCRVQWDAEKQQATEFQPHFGYPLGHVIAPNYSTSIEAAWEVHKKACSWRFSKRREYLRQLRHSVSAREYPQGKIAWPDVMIFLEPIDFCRAAIKVAVKEQASE